MTRPGTILSILVFVFWSTMNTLLVLRERRVASLEQYRAGVTTFLGNAFFRERWMSIHRKSKYLGYTGGTLEKTFTTDGIAIWQTLESRVEIDPLGPIEISGTLVSDQELHPLTLTVSVQTNTLQAQVTGHRSGSKFSVQVKNNLLPLPTLELPLEELLLGDALGPSFPIAGFKVGEKLDVPCFDPLTLKRDIAQVRVVSREVKEFDGILVDAYQLETAFKGIKSRSWVNDAGELLLAELGPPLQDYVLRRTTKADIQKLEKR